MMQPFRHPVLLLVVYAAHLALPLLHTLDHSLGRDKETCGGCLEHRAMRAACVGPCQDPDHDHGHNHHSEAMCLLLKSTSSAPALLLLSGGLVAAVPPATARGEPALVVHLSIAASSLIIRGPPRATAAV